MDKVIKRKVNLKGQINVPGDKSISHRSVMFGSIAKGTTEISGFLTGEDCLSTIGCFRNMGIEITQTGECVVVKGSGLHGLTAPAKPLDVGNSGTTIRLMSGLLAAQLFTCEITGDASIQKRPMDRVLIPLNLMGAHINGANGSTLAPLKITGSPLKGIEYTLPVASAQVKSAVLLASLYADGVTKITEPATTRNHTEIMLNNFGAQIEHASSAITSKPIGQLFGGKICVPGDISSAAYFMAAGLICENSEITITNVGINPTRDGLITSLLAMGAQIKLDNIRSDSGEKTADITVKTSQLIGGELSGPIIPLMIDEIPIYAVCALFAKGTTVIKDAAELKVKESNRIAAMVTELKKMGANIEETDDGMIIEGGHALTSAHLQCYKDHRIAMSLSIAALNAHGETTIENANCSDVSFPGFYELLERL